MQFKCTFCITKNQRKYKSTLGRNKNKLLMCMYTYGKPPPGKEAQQKGSLKDFIPWIYFRQFTVYTKI